MGTGLREHAWAGTTLRAPLGVPSVHAVNQSQFVSAAPWAFGDTSPSPRPANSCAHSAHQRLCAGRTTTSSASDAFERPHLHAVAPVTPNAGQRRTIRLPSGVEPAEVVLALLENAGVAGETMAAHVWLADPTTGTLRLVHAEGPARPDSTPVPIEGTVLGAAVTLGVAQLDAVMRVRTPDEESVVWRYALPLTAGEAQGVAAIDFRGPARPDMERLTPVAGAMRGILAGTLALQVARTETAAARALADTSRDLARMLDPDEVVTTTLERAMALAGAQTGSVMLVGDDGRMHITASRGLPLQVVDTAEVAEGEGIAGWVLASKQSLVVEDLDDRGPRSRRHGVRSAVCVPIADSDGVLGVLNVGSRTFHARFSRSHLLALESLGRTTAVALRNARAAHVVHDLYFDTLKALGVAMEAKDPYALGATARVFDCTMALGEAMALRPQELDALRVAALLHDIGMSAAGDVVAVRERQLSTVEWGLLKVHPLIAAEILAQAPALREAVPIVYHHHEHFDGGGYVGGIAGGQIPLGARILAVADAFVAMTSPRPYRPAFSTEQAIAELTDQAGSQFDPAVVQAFAELAASGRLPLAR
jgi:HD-GYP domain-containing protein (c-di-GMP phosphodiesterase class II)